jgi:restriction endonuclease S subunit
MPSPSTNQMPPTDFLSQFNRVIDVCRNILRTDGITGMDSMKHLTLYILARVLTIQECKRLSISEKFSWDKFMELLGQDKKQEAFNLFFCKNGAEPDLIGALDEKFNTKNFNYKLNKIELHASILKELNKVDLTNLDGQVDILGTVYENHLGSGSNKSAMRDLGQFFTDRKVCNYMVNLCEPKILPGNRAESVLDPTMGTGGFLTSYVKYLKTNGHTIEWSKMQDDVVGCDIDEFVVSIGEINMYLSTGVLFNRISHRDSLQNDVGEPDQRLKFKIILANEPFGVKGLKFADSCKRVKDLGINGTKSEPLFLNLMMAALDKDGRCAVVVPDGVLVNNSKQHNMTREYLLDNFELKRVIKMKGQFFSNTGIQPSILFFENTGFSTSEVEFWEVEQDSKGVIVENMLLSVPRDTLDESCCLDMRRYQEVAAVVNKGGYPMVKLGDLVEIEGGDYITKSSETTGEYPVYGGGAASYHINRFNREPTCVINKDGMSASCVQMVNTRFFLNHHGWTLKLKSADLVEKFLHWQLYSRSDEIFTLATGSCQKGLNQKEFTQFMIYIPPLPIQQEIVTALDLIYNNAATAKAAAASVKSQMAAVVRSVGARGFERKKLEDVASLKQGFPFKSADYISVGEGLYVLKHNNLQDGVVELSKNQDCIASSENTTNYLLKKGDVVVSMDFDCGKVGKIVNDGWVLNQRMSLLRANLQYLSQDYLYWELLLGKFHEDMTNVNTGTTIKHISGKNISEAMITLPPLFIQHEILAILNEMEAELAMLEQMAANAEQRAKFILDGYLTPAE